MTSAPRSGLAGGLILALISTLSFATSGAFVKPLLEAGWSPAAAVVARALVAAAVLAIPAAVALRGRFRLLWVARWRIVAFGLMAVAGTQLAYFAAIERVPIGTALLIEYLAPVLLVLLAWARTRRAPRGVVIAGTLAAVGGLVLVIGPDGSGSLDPLGLLFAAFAAIGLAAYFLVAAADGDGLPAVALAASGLLLGAVVLAIVGATGLVPFTATFGDVTLMGDTVSWMLPVAVVGIVGTGIAYATGTAAIARLGSRVASFVGLLEVVFAVVIAWIVVGETLGLPQYLGGVLIVGGILLVRMDRERTLDETPAVAATEPLPTGPIEVR